MSKLLEALPDLYIMQNDFNERAVPNWKEADLNFPRAFYLEAAELFNHIPWKWWKKEELNPGQAFMEIVDLLHFWISIVLKTNATIYSGEHFQNILAGNRLFPLDRSIDRLVYIGVNIVMEATHPAYISESLSLMVAISEKLGYTEEDLVSWYIGKCALNYFRQDNGSKEGTYIKVWGRLEDNVYLEGIIKNFQKKEIPVSCHAVWQELALDYKTVTGKDVGKCTIPALTVAGKVENEEDEKNEGTEL